MKIQIKIITVLVCILLAKVALSVTVDETSCIAKTTNPNGWIIKTKSSAYQLVITEKGNLKPTFYGSVVQSDYVLKNGSWSESIEEIPVRGGLPLKTPVLEVIFDDKVRDADLRYVNGEVITIDGRPALKIIQKDKFYPLEVTSYIRVLEEFDILEKWIVVKNTGKKGSIKIENLLSGNIVLPSDQYNLTHLAGTYQNEFQLEETLLTPGLKTLQNRSFKTHFSAPWFMVTPQNKEKNPGFAWFGCLHYSGNWQITFDKSYGGPLQIVGGINFWDTSWDLKPGTSFETPKFSVGFTTEGAEGASQNLTAYIRKTILPGVHRESIRPVLYNSWEATFYAVNEQQQLELAKVAKEIGVELFVIDDGWFKGRTTHTAGLGDWELDKVKFPNGLAPLIKQVNDMGMKFGIWVEPECLVFNSDIYRKHPDWILQFPNREKSGYRAFLNLAKEEVYQYLYQSLSKLLREDNIKFIKWDQNTYLTEPGWPDVPEETQREVRIRYMQNFYRLIETLRKEFPDVAFESCASGGGRPDLGMLSRMDQMWISDNTDPLDRLYIQYGYLNMLPANTMVSWVTKAAKHQPFSLEYRFDVSMSGVLGVGDNISKWGEEEKAIAKKKIAEYKIIRSTVQQGVLYKLISPFVEDRCALQYNASDTSVVFCYNMAEYLFESQISSRDSKVLKLKGLDNEQMYKVQKLEDNKMTGTYKGDFLMNIGISWPVKGAYKSQILLITKE